ncbi:hypothetical protein ACSBR1_038621 [Camellia fascicularis]
MRSKYNGSIWFNQFGWIAHLVSEAAIIICGLGFSGWTDSSPPKPRWDRIKNIDSSGVELEKTAAQIPLAWNIQVSAWLRHHVYERLVQKGKKLGFFQLLATQTVNAIWHGLYPGYIIFFVQSALMITGSRASALLLREIKILLNLDLQMNSCTKSMTSKPSELALTKAREVPQKFEQKQNCLSGVRK